MEEEVEGGRDSGGGWEEVIEAEKLPAPPRPEDLYVSVKGGGEAEVDGGGGGAPASDVGGSEG